MTVGDRQNLTAEITPANVSDRSVIWTSSNPAAAVVSGGIVTAVGEGDAVVAAGTANGKKSRV